MTALQVAGVVGIAGGAFGALFLLLCWGAYLLDSDIYELFLAYGALGVTIGAAAGAAALGIWVVA